MVKIIQYLNKYLKYIKIELATSIQVMEPSCALNYYKTSINPTTGLPISGSVDASGCTYGAYNDDFYRRRSSDDDYRNREYYNSLNNNNPYSNFNNSSCSFHDRY